MLDDHSGEDIRFGVGELPIGETGMYRSVEAE
jgi:hypothetical protein